MGIYRVWSSTVAPNESTVTLGDRSGWLTETLLAVANRSERSRWRYLWLNTKSNCSQNQIRSISSEHRLHSTYSDRDRSDEPMAIHTLPGPVQFYCMCKVGPGPICRVLDASTKASWTVVPGELAIHESGKREDWCLAMGPSAWRRPRTLIKGLGLRGFFSTVVRERFLIKATIKFLASPDARKTSEDCGIPKWQVKTRLIDSNTFRNGTMVTPLCHTSPKRILLDPESFCASGGRGQSSTLPGYCQALVSAIFPSTWGRKPGKLANPHPEIQDGLEVMW